MLRRVRRALSLADSPIGRDLPRSTAIAMCAIAVLVVANDLRLFGDALARWRDVPPAVALALFVYLARDNLDAVGARLRPLPSLRFWLRTVLVVALVFAVLIAVSVVVYLALDKSIRPVLPDASWVWGGVVEAPLLEESIYRWLFVTAIAALAPRWVAVVLSGAVFAYLHFVYGNPGPDNFVGGYFFAWMYLRSGSILVPIAFHALGNGALLALNVIAYFALG